MIERRSARFGHAFPSDINRAGALSLQCRDRYSVPVRLLFANQAAPTRTRALFGMSPVDEMQLSPAWQGDLGVCSGWGQNDTLRPFG